MQFQRDGRKLVASSTARKATARRGTILATTIAVGVLSASRASAQDVIRSWDLASASSWNPCAAAGDLDGDGVGDVMIETTPDGISYSVTVYSGATGAVIYDLPGWQYSNFQMNSAGDSDGDGRCDFLIAEEGAATVFVYSGKDGSNLHQFAEPSLPNFGYLVASVGDVNGDGVPDIGGIYFESPTNQGVAVLSGADGSVLFNQFAFAVSSFCMAGDLDGDGAPEIWVGNIGDSNWAGSVTAYSVASSKSILTLNGENADDYFGVSSVNVGDVDADGVSDVAIGAMNFNSGTGRVYVYSGATGGFLGKVDGEQVQQQFGTSLSNSDLNGDGHSDLIVGSSGYSVSGVRVGRIYAFSGATFSLFSTVDGDANDLSIGERICNAGDVDADGYSDVFFMAQVPSFSTAFASRVLAYSMARHARITSATPNRGRYTGGDTTTLSGKYFAAAETPTVTINGAAASNVVVIDDSSLTCDLPSGSPGSASIAVSNSLGVGVLDGALTYTPAVTWDGDATPGGSVALHFLCDPLDGMLAIYGTDPANIPTPPFDGALGIVPFQVAFMFPPKVWPFDHFDLSGNIPNDPSLIGATILVQALDGPSFAKPKDATWTNVGAITIK